MTVISLARVLDVEAQESGWFRSSSTHAGQAPAAAARTVGSGPLPQSLHAYFLRAGRPGRPVHYRIDREFDGRSVCVRSVRGLQEGRPVFTMSASFHTGGESSDVQTEQPLLAGDPDALSPLPSDYLLGMDGRLPAQLLSGPWPTRYWVRSADHLPDSAVVHACALAHVSDAMTPLFPIECPPSRHGPTLSHSVYFHRPVQLDDWVLVDLAPGTIAGGRGFYRGTACAHSGAFVASFGQEAIYRSDLRRGCSAQSTDGLSPKGVRAP